MRIRFVFLQGLALFFLTATLVYTGCQREVEGEITPPVVTEPVVDDNLKVTGSIRGVVIDENGDPVANANVISGTSATTTNTYGVFRFNNIQLSRNNAYVKVEKPGYFTGSRTFLAVANRIHNVKIQLLPKSTSGNFPGATGGSVTLSNGAKLTMPANSVTDASGAAYNGTVNIAMTWIDPTAPNLSDIIPGDLRGITTAGVQRGLKSYGMIGVEMTTPGGQALKIASGKNAELSFPLPSSMAGSAPATIDLWHFDEATGRWKQEGTATKTGNNYIAQVSHFSFWNCDAPFPTVELHMRLMHSGTSQPLNGVYVRLRRGDGSFGSGITDSLGYVSGLVPKNETLTMQVFNSCDGIVHTQNIGPFAVNTDLGTISLNLPASSTMIVSGTLQNCTGGNVTNGSAFIYTDEGVSINVPVTAGTFSAPVLRCSTGSILVYVLGVDYGTGQQGTPQSLAIISGDANFGNVSACGTSASEFVNITVDGSPVNYTDPADISVIDSSFGTPPPWEYTITAQNITLGLQSIAFSSSGSVGTAPFIHCYITGGGSTSGTIVSPSPVVNITAIGAPITGFIEGNFNVQMDFAGSTKTVICTFRVRRP